MSGSEPREDVQALRVPPHSQEAEQSVVGALLIDNSAWDRVADLLSEPDFYRPEHRTIYAALGRLISSGRPADVVTVFDALGSDKAAEIGGLAYINSLAQCVPSAANCRRYAEIVRDRSVLRQLLAKLDEALAIVHGGEGSAAEKVDQVQALFAGMEARSHARQSIGMDQVMVKVIDRINAAAEGKADVFRSGFPGFDRHLCGGGMNPSDLLVLAGRPGMGKTALALQIAYNVAQDGHPVLIISQEMADEQLGLRMVASQAGVDLGHLQTGKLDNNEWARLAEGVDALARLPITVDDEPGLTLRAIASKARKVRGVRLVVVDYLQLAEGDGETRTAQVGSISRGLKKLAKQLDCAVLLLSQLNRNVEQRPGKRPQQSDLRDSGEIEQDADVIAFLWPLADTEGGSRPIGLDIAKNRQGSVASLVLEFTGATQAWAESTRSIDSFAQKKSRGGYDE